MKVPTQLKIRTYRAKQGDTIVHMLIAMAKEFVALKKKINQILVYLEEQKKRG